MGNFYVNLTVASEDRDAIVGELERLGCAAFVSPVIDGAVVVYERESDEQDAEALDRVGIAITAALGCAALGVLNHDDDVLMYSLYRNGEQLDSYVSEPDYWGETPGAGQGGDARVLCEALGVGGSVEYVERVLRDREHVFAVERHLQLVELLGLPRAAVAFGFNYLNEGDMPEGIGPDDLVSTS